VPFPIVTDDDPEAATTWTLTGAKRPPAAAVTTIVRSVESPAVLSVAVALPLLSVVASVTATPPEVAVNVTGTPAIRLLPGSRTSAVIVADAEPSAGMVVALVVAVTAATFAAADPAAPPVPLVLGNEATELPVSLPPQAESRRTARAMNVLDLRILVT
jgi:hypothetical protein